MLNSNPQSSVRADICLILLFLRHLFLDLAYELAGFFLIIVKHVLQPDRPVPIIHMRDVIIGHGTKIFCNIFQFVAHRLNLRRDLYVCKIFIVVLLRIMQISPEGEFLVLIVEVHLLLDQRIPRAACLDLGVVKRCGINIVGLPGWRSRCNDLPDEPLFLFHKLVHGTVIIQSAEYRIIGMGIYSHDRLVVTVESLGDLINEFG